MICPLCGSEMFFEYYSKKPKLSGSMIIACQKGDFITKEATPSECIAEVENAYIWNKKHFNKLIDFVTE